MLSTCAEGLCFPVGAAAPQPNMVTSKIIQKKTVPKVRDGSLYPSRKNLSDE